MLVLGVIAVFASMTFPSSMRMFGQQKLTESAERVRSAIANTRIRAIDTGLIYQFCCEANGSRYVAVPFEPDHANSQAGNQSGPVNIAGRAAGHLPNGITFRSTVLNASGNTAPAQGVQKLSTIALEGLPNAGDLANANWSTPILFNPDGAASADAEITVGDLRSQIVKLHIRAFTGAVSMQRLTEERR